MKPETKITTVEERLALMREGNAQEYTIKVGKLEIPCRLLSAGEEVAAIAKARASTKIPPSYEASSEVLVSTEIKIQVLQAGCTVDNVPYAPRALLDACSTAELEALYDQYITVLRTVNPRFENIPPEEVIRMIQEVKKNPTPILVVDTFYTWQLAEIGRFFLINLLQRDNEAGSS